MFTLNELKIIGQAMHVFKVRVLYSALAVKVEDKNCSIVYEKLQNDFMAAKQITDKLNKIQVNGISTNKS